MCMCLWGGVGGEQGMAGKYPFLKVAKYMGRVGGIFTRPAIFQFCPVPFILPWSVF
jgi:hypothetical protein